MLLGHGRGTVEFRQAPGSLVADDAIGWVTLLVAFVAGAVSVGPYLGEGHVDGATVDDLWELLSRGGASLGWDSLGAVEGFFAALH